MIYPAEVQRYIDILEDYREDTECAEDFRADIIHLYPQELAYPNGYTDSRWFILWAFDTDSMTKRNLGKHDGVYFLSSDRYRIRITDFKVFADGSFLVAFNEPILVDGLLQLAIVKAIPPLKHTEL